MQNFNFNKQYVSKIYYLFMSLEALNLNSIKNYNTYRTKEHSNYNSFYYLNPILLFNRYKKYSYINIIILITILYKTINKNNFCELIQLILKKDKLLNQYIHKFRHIYFNNNNYYILSTYNEQLKINKIAILNLYTMYIITKHTNLLYLIYYILT